MSRGRKVGRKRSDRRWQSADGQLWDSELEAKVYDALDRDPRLVVRRATERDTVAYTTPVVAGRCLDCNCSRVVQDRRYTPDLVVRRVADSGESREFRVEVKGYFPADKRGLFRAVAKGNPDLGLVIFAQRNLWVTKGKTKLTDWAKRFKIPLYIWDGTWPEELK